MKPSQIADGAELDVLAAARELRSEPAYERDGHTARTLVRVPGLRIVLVVIKSSAKIAEHQSQDPASIQAIEGHVRIALPARTVELRPGQLLAIAPALQHAVEAAGDSTILLTLGKHE